MTDTHPSAKNQVSLVERFEPARAVLRPRRCDERQGCWVKIGAAGCDIVGSGSNHCLACGGVINSAGAQVQHLEVLDWIRRELLAELLAERRSMKACPR